MPLRCSQQLLSKILSQIFFYYQEVQVLDSLGSSIHSALVIRLQVEIMMICQGKIIIVIYNQQYQVYESCSSSFIFTNTNVDKIICMWKPIKVIQICKMPGKHNIISYISENDFINFFVVSKSINYLKNVLDSIYKSLAPVNILTKIEMNILVRFEVIQILSFSERQLISRKFTAEFTTLQQSHIKVYRCVLSSSFNSHLCFKICLVFVV